MDSQLLTYLKELVAAQQSGRYLDQMGYVPSRKMCVTLRKQEGGGHDQACEGITRSQLRKLEGLKLMSINSPRSSWVLRLRPAAFEAVK